MGKILPAFKNAIIDDIADGILANTTHYYAFAAFSANTPSATVDDSFINDWQMLFGKKITYGNIFPVISNKIWTTNTVYDIYDNHVDLSESDFYISSQLGGYYLIYKCLDNANGAPSTANPSSVAIPTQTSTFQTADNYKWKYITSISSAVYNRFATDAYMPVYPNSSIVSAATQNSGIDNILIANSGSGYNSYHSGIVQSVNTSIIQIEASASTIDTFYKGNAIYLYSNGTPSSSQLLNVSNSYSNSTGRYIIPDAAPNTSIIQAGVSGYIISPRIKIYSDATNPPAAYCTMNTTSNSIANVIIINSGSNITWANIAVISNTSYGSSANLQAIVPPPGGHGSDPASELFVKGMGIYFTFSNNEVNSIPTNISYSKIGLIKNPSAIDATGVKTAVTSANAFSSILQANLSPTLNTLSLLSVGDTVTGNTSGAVGTVVFCNTSTVFLTGDKTFANNEYIVSSNGSISTTLVINTLGDVYTKDIKPIYVQSISTVSRSNTQNEAFKMIIQI